MLSEEREKEIRAVCLGSHLSWPGEFMRQLLAEIDRLRKISDRCDSFGHSEICSETMEENQRLKERIKRLEIVLTDWLVSTKTDSKNEYCKINQYQAWNANRVLAEGDEAAK